MKRSGLRHADGSRRATAADRVFDLLVIDEAGQGIEPSAWIGLLRCGRVVLAGDHCQLPPTVLSPEAAREGLSVSLLERIVAARRKSPKC